MKDGLSVLTVALCGFALGYILVMFIAFKVQSDIVLTNVAYLITALIAFVATDLRQLLRRITRF